MSNFTTQWWMDELIGKLKPLGMQQQLGHESEVPKAPQIAWLNDSHGNNNVHEGRISPLLYLL